MKATQTLHEHGQSLWLDNITRGMLDSGQIQHYIDRYAVTGLTSNPSIFDQAIESGDYDDAIREKSGTGLSDEELFFELAIEDLRRAADKFLPVHERTDSVDGWVSLEVSPLLAYDTAATIEAAKALYARAARRNLLIKIPGTVEGLPAITECVASGVPVNVTLLFSPDQYRAAAENSGGRMQRLLWASTRTKDPAASDTLYVYGLAAPFTINTMPDATLQAFYDHGEVGTPMPADGGDCDAMLARFRDAGVDVAELAAKLQADGAKSFVAAWNDLLERISAQRTALT